MVVSQVVIQVRRLRRGEITTWSAVLVSNTENAMEDASVNAVKTKQSTQCDGGTVSRAVFQHGEK
jgi:hypothetical protein